MKEQLYTIPVNEGFDEKGECPFCNIYKTLENDSINYMLGPSYMEDDIRAETDKIGFCSKHLDMMHHEKNHLGLALMLHSHIKSINSHLPSLCNNIKSQKKKSILSKLQKTESDLSPHLTNITNSCYICNRINSHFDTYFNTFFYLWKKDKDIKEKVLNSDGFCLKHFLRLIVDAKAELSQKDYDEFIDIILPLEMNNLKRLEEEIDHFINKFDHNYKDAPWGNSKDALPRIILKLQSIFIKE